MDLVLIVLILLLVLGSGGGYYYGGPHLGGSLGAIFLVVLLVWILSGASRRRF